MTTQLQSHGLPALDADGQAHHHALLAQIQAMITAENGFISFQQFMHTVLYTPHLGYYSGQANKFGRAGDFVTAPEISPLFATTFAHQVAQVLAVTNGNLLELGAGTGKLALGLLQALSALSQLPAQYAILEVSADLRARQQAYLKAQLPAALFSRVVWLETLPTAWTGVVIGNEVLDAIPVHVLKWQANQWHEMGVTYAFEDPANPLQWASRPLPSSSLLSATLLDAIDKQPIADGYVTEVCPAAVGLIASLAQCLQRGAMFWIDYGFSAREYYHPQRSQGTLICHFQQRSHDEPFIHLGLQDITAHVDFTAIAEAGLAHGLDCAGYTSQAQFLINCGLLTHLSAISPNDTAQYLPAVAAVQKLVSPTEMGELFKVLALTKHFHEPLLGFVQNDKRHQL